MLLIMTIIVTLILMNQAVISAISPLDLSKKGYDVKTLSLAYLKYLLPFMLKR